jgi:hypothetical protein
LSHSLPTIAADVAHKWRGSSTIHPANRSRRLFGKRKTVAFSKWAQHGSCFLPRRAPHQTRRRRRQFDRRHGKIAPSSRSTSGSVSC